MKTKLPFTLIAICLMVLPSRMLAQNTVTVDANATWNGYANVFFNTVFQFGSSWALGDVKSVINTGNNTVELYPNFNTYNAADPYWSNGEIGNKTFEGNTFVENSALAGQTLTFTGMVTSNTFAAGYEVLAFIKGLNPNTGYSLDVYQHTPLVSGQVFTVTATNIPAGLIVQYGFSVSGLNANPAQATALGNAVVSAAPLATNQFESVSMQVFPNPVKDVLHINALKDIAQITLINLLGQEVLRENATGLSADLNVSHLPKGMYLLNVTSEGKNSVSKIQKN